MKSAFVVTSAVQSKFGVYNPDQRLIQTLGTIQRVRDVVPDCTIAVMEVSGAGLEPKYDEALVNASDYFVDFTTNSLVRDWYQSDNWDVVKNITELHCFPQALSALKEQGAFDDVQRVFKMSGRYLLNDKFDYQFYNSPEAQGKIVIGKAVPSHFPYHVTLQNMQYMCRVLSWPVEMHDYVVDAYYRAAAYMVDRLKNGGYSDIEHCLYYAFDRALVHEVTEIGVEGTIAPNGQPIVN
jgi:hypothetical protein